MIFFVFSNKIEPSLYYFWVSIFIVICYAVGSPSSQVIFMVLNKCRCRWYVYIFVKALSSWPFAAVMRLCKFLMCNVQSSFFSFCVRIVSGWNYYVQKSNIQAIIPKIQDMRLVENIALHNAPFVHSGIFTIFSRISQSVEWDADCSFMFVPGVRSCVVFGVYLAYELTN